MQAQNMLKRSATSRLRPFLFLCVSATTLEELNKLIIIKPNDFERWNCV